MSPAVVVPLWARDTVSDIKSAPETFSSWDKCMQKSYCKWPAIIGIIVGAVVILSVLACVINCLCCGIQCCKGCCGCCSVCCPSGSGRGRSSRPKYMDEPVYHQPPPPPPMNNSYQSPAAPPTYRGATVATFDTPSRSKTPMVNEDALPAMPTWENARTRRIEDDSPHSDDMEMKPLNSPSEQHAMMPPAVRRNGSGYSQVRSNTSAQPTAYSPGYRGVEDHSPYSPQSPGPMSPIGRPAAAASPPAISPAAVSPYDQPYNDYSYGSHAQPRAPDIYAPQQHYNPVRVASPRVASPPAEMPNHAAFQSQPSFGSSPPPTYVSDYQESHYSPHPQPVYQSYSPAHPASPPPPFSSTPHEVNDPGRPPSLLQSGRKPAPNTWKDV